MRDNKRVESEMLAVNTGYEQQEPQQLIQTNNHISRNVLNPALVSVQILKKYLTSGKLSPEQIQLHLDNIEKSLTEEIRNLEDNNRHIEENNILIFKRSG